MNALPGAAEAGKQLKRTALRDFGRPDQIAYETGRFHRLTIYSREAPLPSLYKYALTLIRLEAHGPAKSVRQ